MWILEGFRAEIPWEFFSESGTGRISMRCGSGRWNRGGERERDEGEGIVVYEDGVRREALGDLLELNGREWIGGCRGSVSGIF